MNLSPIKNNKRGQIVDNPVIIFTVIVFGLLLFAPIALKIFSSIDVNFGNALGNVSAGGELAKENFKAVSTPLVTFWDKVIISAFVLAVILLFVSAFFIDANPFFIFLYIFLSFMLILFAPNIVQALNAIYDSATFASEVATLSFLDNLRTNFTLFLVGIIFITGIIIYGKVAFFGNKSKRR